MNIDLDTFYKGLTDIKMDVASVYLIRSWSKLHFIGEP